MKTACFVFLALLLLETHAQTDTSLFDADYQFTKNWQSKSDSTPQKQRILRDTVISILEMERRQKEKERQQYLESISAEDLFKAAFKTERVRAYYFMVRFNGDGKNFGNTEISYDSAFADFTFYSIPFSQYLDSILIPEERSKVNGSDGLFHSKQLRNLGFEINLDEYVYELRIDLPPEIKVLQRMNFGGTTEPRGFQIKPAFFSFYANLYASESFSYNNYRYYDPYIKTDDYNRGAIFLDLDGAMALGGFVLESGGSFKEPQGEETFKKNIKRGDLRLVRDFYSINSRLTLGDVGGVSNLMVYENMAGIRYEHNERIFDRNRLVERAHKISFYLPRASQVEIHIDGKLNRRLFLPSGHHEIHGLTGHSGLNSVQIFVPDENGSLREVRYDFELGDGRALFKGESRYSLTSGFMRSSAHYPATFKYHADKPGLNAEYIYGLFHSLSAGSLLQLSQQNMMGGLQFLNTNPLGYTELFGLMNTDSSSLGKRIDLRHNVNINSPFKYLENLDFSLSGYIQNSTYNPYLFKPKNYVSNNFAGISSSIGFVFLQTYASASLGVSFYHENEKPDSRDWLYGLAVSKNIYGFFLNASATSGISKNITSYYFSLGAAYGFGIDRHNINFSGNLSRQSYHVQPQYAKNPYYNEPPDFDYEMDYEEYVEIPGYSDYNLRKTASLGWDWSNGGGNIGGQSYSANVAMQDNRGNIISNFGARYYFNRMEIGIYPGFSYYEIPYNNSDMRILGIGARASSSFMFADGLWAFGKPVRQGFVLADVDGSLSGSTVRINYSAAYDMDYSRSGWLGAAYQNHIGSYRLNSIEVRLNDMPIGAWVEQNQYYVIGAYKQGYALRLGNDMRTFMQVRLRDEKGPLEKLYVAIFQLDSESKITDKRVTFTAKDGTLQMGNLIPGKKYRLGFDPSTYIKDIEIEIPIDTGPFLELPVIKVERE